MCADNPYMCHCDKQMDETCQVLVDIAQIVLAKISMILPAEGAAGRGAAGAAADGVAARTLGASARIVDMLGAKAADPIAARIASHTNQALDEWDLGMLNCSSKDLKTIAKNPGMANTIKGIFSTTA
jgi:hypothetical protein